MGLQQVQVIKPLSTLWEPPIRRSLSIKLNFIVNIATKLPLFNILVLKFLILEKPKF